MPDERFGEVVAAAVQSRPGADVDAAHLIEHTRALLARYKAPRHVMIIESLERGPSGKADYPAVKERLRAWLHPPTHAATTRSHD